MARGIVMFFIDCNVIGFLDPLISRRLKVDGAWYSYVCSYDACP